MITIAMPPNVLSMETTAKYPWTGRTYVLASAPALTSAAGAVLAGSLWGAPFWAVGLTIVFFWIPGPLSLTSMVLHRDLEEQQEVFLDGAPLKTRLQHYAYLLQGDHPLQRDLRVVVVAVAVAVAGLCATAMVG